MTTSEILNARSRIPYPNESLRTNQISIAQGREKLISINSKYVTMEISIVDGPHGEEEKGSQLNFIAVQKTYGIPFGMIIVWKFTTPY